MSHECQSDDAERVASNICTISVSTSSKTPKESGNGKGLLSSDTTCLAV